MSLLAETDDADLLTLVRDGDSGAMAELWSRHYPATLAAARRVSRQPRDAEEFASDAFAGMLQAVGNDGGPSTSVRGYLLVAVRNQAANRARRSSASDVLTDEITDYEDTGRDGIDPVAHHAELGLVREAFGSLPRRWQTVLWRTAVDHDKNTVIASDLDMSPNAVAALARRARNGFRAAYIQAHASTHGIAPECEPFVPRLVELVGGKTVGPRDVRRHVDDCPRCERRLADLLAIDRDLRGALLPALLALGPGIAWATAGHATHALGGGLWLKLVGGGAGQSRKLAVIGTATAVTVAGTCSAFALAHSGPDHAARQAVSGTATHSSAVPGATRTTSNGATSRAGATQRTPSGNGNAHSAAAVPGATSTAAADATSATAATAASAASASSAESSSTTRPTSSAAAGDPVLSTTAPASSTQQPVPTSEPPGPVTSTSTPTSPTPTSPSSSSPRPSSSTTPPTTTPPTSPTRSATPPPSTEPPQPTEPPTGTPTGSPTGSPTPPPVCLPWQCWPWNLLDS